MTTLATTSPLSLEMEMDEARALPGLASPAASASTLEDEDEDTATGPGVLRRAEWDHQALAQYLGTDAMPPALSKWARFLEAATRNRFPTRTYKGPANYTAPNMDPRKLYEKPFDPNYAITIWANDYLLICEQSQRGTFATDEARTEAQARGRRYLALLVQTCEELAVYLNALDVLEAARDRWTAAAGPLTADYFPAGVKQR
jgi:hypothetical protein